MQNKCKYVLYACTCNVFDVIAKAVFPVICYRFGVEMVEGSSKEILELYFWILHTRNPTFYHQYYPNRLSWWDSVVKYAIYMPEWRPSWKNGRHLEFMVASVFFQKKVTPKEYLCQVWCLYHIFKDSFTYRLNIVGLGYSTWVGWVVSTEIMQFNESE